MLARLIRLSLAAALIATPALAKTFQTSAGPVEVERMATGLDFPWSLAFLPDGGKLVTERDGKLIYFSPEWRRHDIEGLPQVSVLGQSGLFDVLVPKDFAETREIYLTYTVEQPGGNSTRLSKANLSEDNTRLTDIRVLFDMADGRGGGRHYGGRLAELPDGTILMTTGDLGQRPRAQETDVHHGKTIRLNRDGSVPKDNPFVNGPHRAEVYTIGHRNPQGLALDEEGRAWTNSHGARGGDEVNLLGAGKNYGWPVISYGRHYSFLPIGEGTHKEGLEQPRFHWDPSIAPSGLMIYSGKLFPEWKGDLFVGSLKFDMIAHLKRNGDQIVGEERLFEDEYIRIRDIREGPDGAIWFLSVGDEALYRVIPAD